MNLIYRIYIFFERKIVHKLLNCNMYYKCYDSSQQAGGFPHLIRSTSSTPIAFAQEENDNANNTTGSTTTTHITTTSTLKPLLAGIGLSPQPVWQEQATNTIVTLLNKTHTMITSVANGTLTQPHSGKTISVTTRHPSWLFWDTICLRKGDCQNTRWGEVNYHIL